jgi:hypothetical protein
LFGISLLVPQGQFPKDHPEVIDSTRGRQLVWTRSMYAEVLRRDSLASKTGHSQLEEEEEDDEDSVAMVSVATVVDATAAPFRTPTNYVDTSQNAGTSDSGWCTDFILERSTNVLAVSVVGLFVALIVSFR